MIKRLVTLDNPHSGVSEIYRKIRTNIEFSNIDKPLKVVNVTSVQASEAKSTTSCNIAIMFANKLERVLLIDTDLRKPSIHSFFKVKNEKGLTDLMLDFSKDETSVKSNDYVKRYRNEQLIYDLDIMTTGTKVSNPAEFLGSKTFKRVIEALGKHYDIIILDSAPSGIIVDGVIVSSIADGTVFVTQHNTNSYDEVKTVINTLKQAGANLIGGLITKSPVKNSSLAKDNYYHQYYADEGNGD